MHTLLMTFTTITCECGVVYALPDSFIKELRRTGNTFYCPNKCPRWYGEGETEKLKKKVARLEGSLDQEQASNTHLRKRSDRLERSRNAYKGQATKIKNRVKNGVCPCCNRHFKNLERHMKGQHPQWAKSQKETK